ncbi:MAG: hypothetical protein QOJ23_4378, partial [Actinomycetota bacterium]|nr:hypothetical protein [Actinomycetota bacterium]
MVTPSGGLRLTRSGYDPRARPYKNPCGGNRGFWEGKVSSMPREGLLTRTFVELADTLVDDFDVVELLTLLAHR